MMPINRGTTDLKKAIAGSVAVLRRLREEIRIDIHLARMDAKDRWHALEPQFAVAEKAAHDISEATKQTLSTTVEAFQLLKASLAVKP